MEVSTTIANTGFHTKRSASNWQLVLPPRSNFDRWKQERKEVFQIFAILHYSVIIGSVAQWLKIQLYCSTAYPHHRYDALLGELNFYYTENKIYKFVTMVY
jgi:hypothetical protein